MTISDKIIIFLVVFFFSLFFCDCSKQRTSRSTEVGAIISDSSSCSIEAFLYIYCFGFVRCVVFRALNCTSEYKTVWNIRRCYGSVPYDVCVCLCSSEKKTLVFLSFAKKKYSFPICASALLICVRFRNSQLHFTPTTTTAPAKRSINRQNTCSNIWTKRYPVYTYKNKLCGPCSYGMNVCERETQTERLPQPKRIIFSGNILHILRTHSAITLHVIIIQRACVLLN